MKTVFITGIADSFDTELAKVFAENGYKVYTADNPAEEPGHIDIYIDTADFKPPEDNFAVSGDIDYALTEKIYAANVLKPVEMYENYLPLVQKGEVKRYCFITSANACINHCGSANGYGYNMSKAGLHNFLQIIKNKLSPEGFTFRAFDPLKGEMAAEKSSKAAFNYFTRRRGGEGGRDDESKLVLRDANGVQWGW